MVRRERWRARRVVWGWWVVRGAPWRTRRMRMVGVVRRRVRVRERRAGLGWGVSWCVERMGEGGKTYDDPRAQRCFFHPLPFSLAFSSLLGALLSPLFPPLLTTHNPLASTTLSAHTNRQTQHTPRPLQHRNRQQQLRQTADWIRDRGVEARDE